MIRMDDTREYNGWANYETWNVALWIGNSRELYSIARECETYSQFIKALEESGIYKETSDGVAWNDSAIDRKEINEMMAEWRSEDSN